MGREWKRDCGLGGLKLKGGNPANSKNDFRSDGRRRGMGKDARRIIDYLRVDECRLPAILFNLFQKRNKSIACCLLCILVPVRKTINHHILHVNDLPQLVDSLVSAVRFDPGNQHHCPSGLAPSSPAHVCFLRSSIDSLLSVLSCALVIVTGTVDLTCLYQRVLHSALRVKAFIEATSMAYTICVAFCSW